MNEQLVAGEFSRACTLARIALYLGEADRSRAWQAARAVLDLLLRE
jgi:hypothetical protein